MLLFWGVLGCCGVVLVVIVADACFFWLCLCCGCGFCLLLLSFVVVLLIFVVLAYFVPLARQIPAIVANLPIFTPACLLMFVLFDFCLCFV